MKLTFWGVRGSLPVPGEETVIYGGNTTCLEVEGLNGDINIVDAGTGIRKLGNDLMRRMNGKVKVSLLLTHGHWDHIQGFPFFIPAYVPSCTLDIYGGDKSLFEQLHQQQRQSETSFLTRNSLDAVVDDKISIVPSARGTHTRELLEGQQDRIRGYFPIGFDQMKAKITTHDLRPHEMIIPGMSIGAAYFDERAHPGGMFSYQFNECGKRLVFTGDYNHDGAGRNQFGENDFKLIEWTYNADALVYATEKLFRDFEGKADSKELETVKGKVMELKELLKSEKRDVSAIKTKMDEINEIVQKLSTELYQKAAEQHKKEHPGEQKSEEENSPNSKDKDEKVVDAEYEVKDENEVKDEKKKDKGKKR